jgi:hypothetical protein
MSKALEHVLRLLEDDPRVAALATLRRSAGHISIRPKYGSARPESVLIEKRATRRGSNGGRARIREPIYLPGFADDGQTGLVNWIVIMGPSG